MATQQSAPLAPSNYVGTLVGESTSREFRIAVAHETIREQDIIAVDAELRPTDGAKESEEVRIWAKVQRIERLNPLFPTESGHELAATRTSPFDTVLSLSREMVTAVCQVLGAEPRTGDKGGKLNHVRYPPQPATSAYRPAKADVARVVLGDLEQKKNRALDIAVLTNRPEIDVNVDGHAIVTRHLAILAMTGAGKSWTARRIIEELGKKKYPIVIFDPHGDYTGLVSVEDLNVSRYYAHFPVFEEDVETVERIVSTLGYELSPTMQGKFTELFEAAKSFLTGDQTELAEKTDWLTAITNNSKVKEIGLKPNLWLLGHLAQAAEIIIQQTKDTDKSRLIKWGWESLGNYTKTDARTLEAIKKRSYSAAAALSRMEKTNRIVAQSAEPLPLDRKDLVKYGQISVISLAGYTGDFQATIYSLIAENLFEARIDGTLKYPALLVLEEAHNFAPAHASTSAEQRSITATKQIAQEGRKFGIGLILISQRPSRLDETTLSQCNSFVIMRLVNPADQNFVRKVVESLGEEEAKMLPDLDVGEALLSGQLINFPVLTRIKEPVAKGEREEEDAFALLARIHEDQSTDGKSKSQKK